MKIISVWSFELDVCKEDLIEEFPNGRYTLTYNCGLVVSSWFFARLPIQLRHKALFIHKEHHTLGHYAPDLWGLASYSPGRSRAGTTVRTRLGPVRGVICGPVCGEFARGKFRTEGLIDRSDIGYYPLAKIKEDNTVLELRLTASNQLLCSCSTINPMPGSVCRHVVNLLSGKAKGVVWSRNKEAGAKIIKRKMLFDE